MSAAGAHCLSARGAKLTTPHGPLQRLLAANGCDAPGTRSGNSGQQRRNKCNYNSAIRLDFEVISTTATLKLGRCC